MRRFFAVTAFVVLAGCSTTGAPVVPDLSGTPRVPVNKTKPEPVAISPVSPVLNQGE